jgi:hypothetical protein
VHPTSQAQFDADFSTQNGGARSIQHLRDVGAGTASLQHLQSISSEMTLVNHNAAGAVLTSAMNTMTSHLGAKRTNNSYFKMMKQQLKAHGKLQGGGSA